MTGWAGLDSSVALAVVEQNDRLLEVYRADPGRLEQDANIERSVSEGAYAKRQLWELLQNAADAMRDGAGGRCEVVLTDSSLYVANTGAPLSVEGVLALMATHRSVKRGEQIGRFGLGFKSALAVSDTPMILSRSGSLAFDRAWSREVLGDAFPGRVHYPATRLARPVDTDQQRSRDKVLEELMGWATTVVVLPVSAHHDALTNSVRIFPAEFLLFSQHVNRLDLKDRSLRTARRISLQRGENGLLELDDAGKPSLWVVESKFHAPSRAALVDGGYQAARESVQMTWAAPVEGARVGVGAFWAFFPSSSLTTLSGIVNAPWKLADDRETLLPGKFNDEMLTSVLPTLVANALPRIHRPRRPAAVIDVLPARGKEIRNFADDAINQPVYEAVTATACIPSLGGTLRHPTRIRLHPDKLEAEELELWRNACRDPDWWVDHSILSAERRSKVARLLGFHNRSAVTVKEWLEHLVKDATVEGSATAVRLVSMMVSRRPELRTELTSARVLLLDDGSLHACRPGQVFLPGGSPDRGKLIIDSRLAGFLEVSKALHSLGIRLLDEAGALRSELSVSPIRWDNVWLSARRIPLGEAEETFRAALGSALLTDLRVRSRSGRWKPPGRLYLPGPIVPGGGGRDSDHVVDDRFHQQDLPLLERLGLVRSPRVMGAPPTEPWRLGVESQLRDDYRNKMQRPRLSDESIEIEPARLCWPLEPLKELSPEGKTELTRAVLNRIDSDSKWTIAQRDGTGKFTTLDPTWRYLRAHGWLLTEIGIQPVRRCIVWDDDAAVVDGIRQPLPYVEESIGAAASAALGLRTAPDQLSPEDWVDLLEQAGGWTPERRTLLYAWAAWCDQPPPPTLKASRGRGFVKVTPQQTAVTASVSVYESLLDADCPVLLTISAEDADTLRDHWGLTPGKNLLEESLEPDFAGEPFLVMDRFPPLRTSLPPEWHDLTVQPCSRLELLTATPTGQRSRPLDERRVDMTVLTTATSDRDLLLSIGRAIEVTIRPDVVLKRMEEQRKDRNRLLLAETADVHHKLVLAIGVDALRASIPEAALTALMEEQQRDLTDLEIARLAVAVDGYAVLQNHATELDRNGLRPPGQWAGSRSARDWIRGLGFPIEFAGVPGDRRAAEVEVEGPPVLGPLHDYQQQIAIRIRDLLDPAAETRRGLVPLPTGAGKTRVAVQALVEHMITTPDDLRIIWVAETDELCEQAIQSWSQVWRAKGAPGVPMTLSRLWAGNEANERDGKQVVIASVAKLASIVGRGDQVWESTYGWMADPAMIVVDEAHRSIGPQYSEILSRLGGARRVADMTTPLLGLTATPFRGWNERETEILAGRYHRNKLDAGVFPDDDAYGHLQQMGVLASVRQIALTGASITLTDAELADATKYNRVPDTLEQRLGRDEVRNNTIVASLLDLADAATALVFASSVENARVLAAMLTYHGIDARAISGKTDTAARRRYIEEFRARRVRVLTNYNVFTEGFDVPSVDAVYITRPTFSPNVYQQMIGRGLRGRLNGGKDEVLVVNVDDNLTNFGEQFAFRHFAHLWNGARL